MNREKIINAIEKAKKQSEEYAQDRIIVPFKEADMILALLKEQDKSRLEIAHEMVSNSTLMYQGQELVRCKDCVHWDKGHTEECDNSDSVCFHNGWCKQDWFCADGERRAYDA